MSIRRKLSDWRDERYYQKALARFQRISSGQVSSWTNTTTFALQQALEAWDKDHTDTAAMEEVRISVIALLAATDVLFDKVTT